MVEKLIEVKSAKEFVERIENKESVSRFEVKLLFKWDAKNSKILRSADLRSANLRYADLRSADLRSANLRYADLYYADLCYANLRFADLCSANLCSADLCSADLCSAKGEFTFNFGVKLRVVGDK